MQFTIALQHDAETSWYVGQLLESPGVISQGRTEAELRENLIDALNLYLEVQRDNTVMRYENDVFERVPLIV